MSGDEQPGVDIPVPLHATAEQVDDLFAAAAAMYFAEVRRLFESPAEPPAELRDER